METTFKGNEGTPREVRQLRVRHPLLTVWLAWLVVANALTTVSAPFLLPSMRRPSIPDFPDWAGWVVGGLSAVGAGCVWALFRWKRWGFYGYLMVAVCVFAVNVAFGVGPAAAALGFVGSGILCMALLVGGPNRAWPQLV